SAVVPSFFESLFFGLQRKSSRSEAKDAKENRCNLNLKPDATRLLLLGSSSRVKVNRCLNVRALAKKLFADFSSCVVCSRFSRQSASSLFWGASRCCFSRAAS